jgi:hypothetical protein
MSLAVARRYNGGMTQALLLDLVEWVAAQPRTYSDTMAAWRTSCPRHTIWEDAVAGGFIKRDGRNVAVTAAGIRLLRDHARIATDSDGRS